MRKIRKEEEKDKQKKDVVDKHKDALRDLKIIEDLKKSIDAQNQNAPNKE